MPPNHILVFHVVKLSLLPPVTNIGAVENLSVVKLELAQLRIHLQIKLIEM